MMRQLEIDFGPDAPLLSPETILRASFERVRRRYFRGRFPGGPVMSFGLLRKSSIRTIGKAEIDARRILVHPLILAPPWHELLDFVMYHEMLHFAEFYHNARFRARERRFARHTELGHLEAEFFRFLEGRQQSARQRPGGRRRKAASRAGLTPARRTWPGNPRCAESP
jgi:hypothetical protein